MDIYSYEGEKIRFNLQKCKERVPLGKEALKHLKDGTVYTVDFIWVSHSSSVVYLKEFSNVSFNPVYFNNVDQEGRRDHIFAEEFQLNFDFQNFIHRIVCYNSRLRFGLSPDSVSKEFLFSYFDAIPYDRNQVKFLNKTNDMAKTLFKEYGHSEMQHIHLICTYHNLVCFYFWNGPNQFLEFFEIKQVLH